MSKYIFRVLLSNIFKCIVSSKGGSQEVQEVPELQKRNCTTGRPQAKFPQKRRRSGSLGPLQIVVVSNLLTSVCCCCPCCWCFSLCCCCCCCFCCCWWWCCWCICCCCWWCCCWWCCWCLKLFDFFITPLKVKVMEKIGFHGVHKQNQFEQTFYIVWVVLLYVHIYKVITKTYYSVTYKNAPRTVFLTEGNNYIYTL